MGHSKHLKKENTKELEIVILNLTLLVFILIAIFTDLGIYGITISYILAKI